MRRILIVLFVLFMLVSAGCRQSAPAPNRSGNSNPTPASTPEPATSPESSADHSLTHPALGGETIEYRDYRMTRGVKTVKPDYLDREVEILSAVLKYWSKTVMTFDPEPDLGGNRTGFGLFSLLGKEEKQLVVEMIGYRRSEHWVIDLYPRLRVVYHSSERGFEGPLTIEDLDHDGVAELMTPVSDYDMFAGLPVCCPPDVIVILKYSPRSKKFIPANYLFPDEVARKNAAEIPLMHAAKNPLDHMNDRLHILNIVFRYLYAGQEREGWEFFEKEFNEPDKDDVRREMKEKLAHEPIFQYLRPHRKS